MDCINTVQFSNHTQYKTFTGTAINEDEIQQLIKGLKENNLFNYTHMLTGIVFIEIIFSPDKQ